ncbi:MAG: M23 family metallopeptidase [Chitinophaga sp.]|uniref:M23 family metallopeptidase n=1 Tax=Chitinophaga sp. TaxID=1869181 RepID=UPI001AFF2FFC|nr:M23 family metallopeptidase [Chitinophaga sp.]MBO9729515.1 M23 family metallopeptidase [Chitinophaga sp.]
MKQVVIVFKIIGALGVIGFFGDKHFLYLLPFYLIGVILGKVEKYRSKKPESGLATTAPDLTHYYSSVYLSLLNPFNIVLLAKQLLGQLYILVFYSYRLPSPATFQNKVQYILPFRGTWKVGRGGITADTSHSWNLYTQRYAYDFFMTDTDDKPNNGTGNHLDDYYCFDQEVIAPADGTVVAVKNSIPDYTHVGDLSVDWKSRDFRGNYVIIQHAANEYSFIAHFKQGSIVVSTGDVIKQGQLIGRCGNSGHSTMPHIHFHLQNSRKFWIALGLPITFNDIVIADTPNNTGATYITGGQLVHNCH